jgi:hypothetical protein
MGSAALVDKEANARNAAMTTDQRKHIIGSRITLHERWWRS